MSSSAPTVVSRLAHLVEPVVRAAGYDLEALDVTPAGKRRLVRVVVDRDGGVDLDDVATLSDEVSTALDAPDGDAALGAQPYVLEVTSPGVDRPLTQPRHWRRAVGRLVAVKTSDGESVTGRVTAATDESADLDAEGQARTIAYADVVKARVEVEFRRVEGGQA